MAVADGSRPCEAGDPPQHRDFWTNLVDQIRCAVESSSHHSRTSAEHLAVRSCCGDSFRCILILSSSLELRFGTPLSR